MKRRAAFLAFLIFPVFAFAVDVKPLPRMITDAERQQIYDIGKKNQVPLSVVKQLIAEESTGDCHARSNMTKEGFYSKGVLQLYDKPGNIDWLLTLFWKGDKKDFYVYDPIDNATVALAYLAWLHDRYGNWLQALIYYNHGNITGYSKETRAYALRIINAN